MRIWYAFCIAIVLCFLLLASDMKSLDDVRPVATVSAMQRAP